MVISKGMQLHQKSLRELHAKFDAYPEQEKKELCDLMFKHTEEIIKSCRDNLKYTEPLRIIGYGSLKL